MGRMGRQRARAGTRNAASYRLETLQGRALWRAPARGRLKREKDRWATWRPSAPSTAWRPVAAPRRRPPTRSAARQAPPAGPTRRGASLYYVSSSEAFWRLFGFAMHAAAPNIVRLHVHLPSQNMVVFPADLEPSALLANLRK